MDNIINSLMEERKNLEADKKAKKYIYIYIINGKKSIG